MKKILFSLFIISGSSSISKSQPVTFGYTGTVQTYTVGACVYSITVDAKGAEGGTSATIPGKGGRVQATIPVTPGDILNIYVGEKANINTGGWNGGGNAGSTGEGGGGASDIRQNGTGLSNRIIVAGGGGGGGSYWDGGSGGGAIGIQGETSTWGGGGGTQTAGGAGGTYFMGNGFPGSLGTGGNGNTDGGGGGGGLYGGGGGATTVSGGGGGGGGSNYAISTATGVVHTQGFQTGNGQIIITPSPASGPPAPGTITGMAAVCAGTIATYSISSVPTATSFTWTVPPGAVINSGTSATITVTFGSTSGNISVTASNSCGTSSASTKSVTVTANLPVSTGNDITLCNGQSTTLTATGGINYLWSTGETTSSITVSPSTSTTYTVMANDAGGCSGSDSVMVTVNPALADSVTTNPATCGNNDGSASVTPSGGTGIYTFLWSNGNTTSAVTGLTGQPTDTLYVTITDASGCTVTDTAIVECVTGIAYSSAGLSIRVFPNPTTGKFSLSLSPSPNGEGRGEVEIFNVMGVKIFTSLHAPLSRGNGIVRETIDLSSHPSGIYFVKTVSVKGSFMSKIVKQ